MKKKFIVIGVALMLAIGCVLAVTPYSSAEAKNIIKGDTKENITIVQTRLQELGYYKIRIDGIWGPKTLAGVKNFQRDYGLVVDGIVGARTEKALGITLKSSSSSSSSVSKADLNLLARCVYAEARGEPYTGQVAVAAVVLNRVRSSKFPNTISDVIYQPLAFTAVADGSISLPTIRRTRPRRMRSTAGIRPTAACTTTIRRRPRPSGSGRSPSS